MMDLQVWFALEKLHIFYARLAAVICTTLHNLHQTGRSPAGICHLFLYKWWMSYTGMRPKTPPTVLHKRHPPRLHPDRDTCRLLERIRSASKINGFGERMKFPGDSEISERALFPQLTAHQHLNMGHIKAGEPTCNPLEDWWQIDGDNSCYSDT